MSKRTHIVAYSNDLHISYLLFIYLFIYFFMHSLRVCKCRKYAMKVNSCFCVLRSDLWWPDTRSQWNYRESWLSPRLPKLCQLYMDHSHWRAK